MSKLERSYIMNAILEVAEQLDRIAGELEQYDGADMAYLSGLINSADVILDLAVYFIGRDRLANQ